MANLFFYEKTPEGESIIHWERVMGVGLAIIAIIVLVWMLFFSVPSAALGASQGLLLLLRAACIFTWMILAMMAISAFVAASNEDDSFDRARYARKGFIYLILAGIALIVGVIILLITWPL